MKAMTDVSCVEFSRVGQVVTENPRQVRRMGRPQEVSLMTSHFDQLVEELRRTEAVRDRGETFAKANENPLPRVKATIARVRQALDAAQKALPPAPTLQERREFAAKSLSALNMKIAEAAATGSITGQEAARLEGQMHLLAQRAARKLGRH